MYKRQVMPIEEAGAAIKEKNPATLFHVDAIKSYGKLEIRPKRMNIDTVSYTHLSQYRLTSTMLSVRLHRMPARLQVLM